MRQQFWSFRWTVAPKKNSLSLLCRPRIWLDVDEKEVHVDAMIKGVTDSIFFLLFLTKGMLSRPYCQLEIRTAMELNKPIIVVADEPTDKENYGGAL